jgi:hypothetical protein
VKLLTFDTTKNITVLPQQQHLITQTHPAKPWRPSEAQDQARRRGTSSSSQEEKGKLKPGASQEVKDKQQPSQEE